VIAGLGADVVRLDDQANHLGGTAATDPSTAAAARRALANPRARLVPLTDTGPGAKRAAEVVMLDSKVAYLLNNRLAALPAGFTYQLWAVLDGQPISVGLLGTHPVAVAFALDSAVSTSEFTVTVEPAAGVVAPTQAPVATSLA
jgi:hypothetical protein